MKQIRLDKWLFFAQLCRTRETAQTAIEGGKVRLNGARIQKPGHAVKPGDVLTVALGGGAWVVKIRELAEKRSSAAEAVELYEVLPD